MEFHDFGITIPLNNIWITKSCSFHKFSIPLFCNYKFNVVWSGLVFIFGTVPYFNVDLIKIFIKLPKKTGKTRLKMIVQIHDKSFELLIPENAIIEQIESISSKIYLEYGDKRPLFIGVLNGSFVFAAELFKNLEIEAEITFVRVKSYASTQSLGKVTEVLGLTENIENRDIIIVEDIVDTGLTIKEIIFFLQEKSPKSIKIATLLFKPKALKANISPDFIGFEIEPKFVVGYGLDYDGLGRNLRGIYVLKE